MAARLPHLVLLTTGGTIMATARDVGTLTGYAIDQAAPDLAPDLAALIVGIAQLTVDPVARIPSTDMGADQLLDLARRLARHLAEPEVDAALVTHGTDTLEETALFLDLTLPRGKPVVLTGAMRPAGALGADGPRNLLNAARIACHADASGRGVLVTMDDQIIAATAARKRHTTALDAFRPTEGGLLGGIVADRVVFFASASPRAPEQPAMAVETIVSMPRVDILYAHQDHPAYLFAAAIDAGVAGLVLACTGNGSLSATGRRGVEEAIAQGLVVVRASRTGAGHVSWDDLPGIMAGTLNPQQARILLMLALTRTRDAVEIGRMFAGY
jgi:L-asparaginase